jgi:glycosyltransferase EpsD
MNKKVLFVATIAKHFLRFHIPYFKWFKDQGYEVHVACQGNEIIPYCDVKHLIAIERNPFHTNNLKAIQQLREISINNDFKLIHCHTAMGSVITRLACKNLMGSETKILYTAHGFHFFKGSPKFYWLLYYPMEKYLSKFTDAIITINREDFDLLKSSQFKNKHSFQINGIGVSNDKFTPVNRNTKIALRKLNNFDANDFILIYVAEFINRKNHQFIIECSSLLKTKIPNLKIVFAGRGILKDKMELKVNQLHLNDTINFLGFRDDVNDLMRMADVGISASKQEGLGLNLIEEMMVGLPIVATIDRGHNEIVIHGENGYLFEQNNKLMFNNFVLALANDPEKYNILAKNAIKSSQKFALSNSLIQMENIYKKFI